MGFSLQPGFCNLASRGGAISLLNSRVGAGLGKGWGGVGEGPWKRGWGRQLETGLGKGWNYQTVARQDRLGEGMAGARGMGRALAFCTSKAPLENKNVTTVLRIK